MQIILGLCGKAGCGKGEVSKILQKHFKTYVLPFAKPLKEMAKGFGWDGQKDEKGRKYLQLLGTEIGRAYNQNYWVERWTEEAETALAKTEQVFGYPTMPPPLYEILVADDTRFDNEADVIHKFGGSVVKIEGRAYDLGNNATHASEKGIHPDLIDYTIDNSADMQSLEAKVLHLIKLIRS